MKKWIFMIFLAGLCGCNSHPADNIPAVKSFELPRYLGKWYEIARLPNHFERGMSHVTATYTLRPDGTVNVVNQGIKNGKPVSITGVARAKNSPADGELEVSFFRPVYSDYRIIKLAPDYRYSIVTGSSRRYLWILARQVELSAADKNTIMEFLRQHHFPTGELIYSQR